MAENSCFCSGASLFGRWIMPESLMHDQLGDFYRDYPVGSRVIATPLALFSGAVKVFLFPVICAVGVVVMPIIAIVHYAQGKEDSQEWLCAWAFSILGVGATLAFIGGTTFHFPLNAIAGVIVGLISISIIVHVHLLVKEPVKELN